MPFVPIPNTAQVELRMQQAGQSVENVLYFRFPTPPAQSDLQTLANAISTWWFTYIKPLQSAFVVYRESYVTNLTNQTAPTAVDLSQNGVSGTISPADSLPNNATCAISFRTAGRGRSSRGRNYVIGLSESQVTQSNLISTVAASYTAAYQRHITNPPTGWTWVVASRFENKIPRASGLTFPIISCGFADLVMDSQRQRLPGRGN